VLTGDMNATPIRIVLHTVNETVTLLMRILVFPI
jgi:hypothetical protein